jgi:hypothetical protein
MSIQYPKKERAGVNMVAYEVPHIYRDPPKSIFTRKKETVNIADVMYMARPDNDYGDPTRVNESIQVFARGRNPMVQVDMGQGQGVKSPYKLDVVRPPMMPIETLVAISAPHIHQNYAAHTNPGSNLTFPMSIGDAVDQDQIKGIIHEDVTAGIMRTNPTLPLEFGPTVDFNTVKSNITENLEGIYQTNAGLQYIGIGDEATRTKRADEKNIKDTLLKVINSNFSSITLYDPKTNNSIDISANIKDKNYIAINAAKGKEIDLITRDGTPVKLKDYTYSIVNTNAGNPQIVIQVQQPEVILDRNTPIYSSRTNMVSTVGYNEDIMRNSKLSFNQNDKLSNFGSFEDRVSRPQSSMNSSVPMGNSIRRTKNLSSVRI